MKKLMKNNTLIAIICLIVIVAAVANPTGFIPSFVTGLLVLFGVAVLFYIGFRGNEETPGAYSRSNGGGSSGAI